MNVRILARAVVYDAVHKRILLVKNKGAAFWYAPGGGWEADHETIQECAVREVLEETGLEVTIKRFLYLQEFHESPETIFFETFWLAEPKSDSAISQGHIDLDPNGSVEAVQWFGTEEIKELAVFPKRLKQSFWQLVDERLVAEDPFIGVSFARKT